MNGLAQHETRHIVSAIDIQLWARAAPPLVRPHVRCAIAKIRPAVVGDISACSHGAGFGVCCSLLPVDAIAALSQVITAQLRPGDNAYNQALRACCGRSSRPMKRSSESHRCGCELRLESGGHAITGRRTAKVNPSLRFDLSGKLNSG
jgi:hypothetical protein